MQQLTLQFDGYADEQQRVDVVAPARKTVQVMNRAAARTRRAVISSWVSRNVMAGEVTARLKVWMAARSETFTALCGSEGDVFTHGDVVKGHLCLAAVIILIGIGGAL